MDNHNQKKQDFLSDIGTVITNELLQLIDVMGIQFSYEDKVHNDSQYRKSNYLFSPSFYKDAKEYSLSETDAIYIYEHGSKTKEDILVYKFNGYELGIKWFTDSTSGLPMIDEIWKKNL